ncbi:CheR family methyltransferase [Vibrio salinus]|uniref:CheR family methyltransferase n=1 Tax=Vibrio salinus TaxID=2899784 RepID=UPI001E3A6A02|nr:protein-glutamate O-methyltransferase CheR [Vibrio salinus]MCE0492446.1 protein-glutamate O-methyltransferase CheR [Vibrio salinus]
MPEFNLFSSEKDKWKLESVDSRLAKISPINRHEFLLFKELLYKRVGIHLTPTKKTLLETRLVNRLAQLGFSTFFDYYQYILGEQGKKESQILIDLLTTNETFFFREPAHFNYLQEKIIPHYNHSPLRVWSAACSSGEETYSLAMLLDDFHVGAKWELIGSDISQRVLKKAQAGHYQMLRHEGIPLSYLKKYCLRGTGTQNGTLLITKPLRDRVHFCQVNLNAQLTTMGMFDIVFLRNVLIYFNKEKKADIVKRVSEQLNPGGYLFISHTENLQGIDVNLRMVRPSIFRKSA